METGIEINRDLTTASIRHMAQTLIAIRTELRRSSISWLDPSEMAVTIVAPGEYKKITKSQTLSQIAVEDAVPLINTAVQRIPTALSIQRVRTRWVDIIGEEDNREITYVIDDRVILDEREKVIKILDKSNVEKTELPDIEPNLVIATIKATAARNSTKDVLTEHMPPYLDLHFLKANPVEIN